MTINQKLSTIQSKFKSKKSRFNSFGKYYFRSAEDILESIKPFLLELGVTVTISERLVETSIVLEIPIVESCATLSDGENTISATALVGVDLKQKGMQTPQQFGTASSYGKKYALGNLLLIDDTQDSDATNNHGKNPSLTSSFTKPKASQVKPKLADIEKALTYMKAGGKLDTIKAKYQLTSQQETKLNTVNG